MRVEVALGVLFVFLGACGGATAGLDPGAGDAGPTDAASDAGCTGTPPILQCGGGCAGQSPGPEQAVCMGTGWACPPPPMGCGFASFRCGPEDAGVYCATQRQYCAIDRFSPPTCEPLPSGCESCGCADAGTPPICVCSDDGGVTVTCTPP